MINAFILAGILAVVHYFSEEYSSRIEHLHAGLVSFSAGVFITFIFIELFPKIVDGIEFVGSNIFLAMLTGFIAFHIGEKYIYQHITNKKDMLHDLGTIHAAGFFIDHFTVGVALYLALSVPNAIFGLAIFLPLLLHTMSSSLSLSHIDEVFARHSVFGLLLPLSPVLGVAFAVLLNPAKPLYYLMFAFVLGALFYVVTRDMLPQGRKGEPLLFILGFAVSLLLLASKSFLL